MSDERVLYIAGMGMVTPVGANVEMTAAAVKAGISGYAESEFYTRDDQPITMSLIPDDFFADFEVEIDEGNFYGAQHDRVIKMAMIAIQQALSNCTIKGVLPLILAFPEPTPEFECRFSEALRTNLLLQKDIPFQKEYMHSIYTGRSGGIEAIDLAFSYLYDQDFDFVLVGASDSYFQCNRLFELDEANRLLSPTNVDGFAPGEGAGFLLLAKSQSFAKEVEGHTVRLNRPGLSTEWGHFYSDETYLGEGLDKAFKSALSTYQGRPIDTIYASMNGEKYWSKEYGVAMVRNNNRFHENFKTVHPVDCLGDQGAASGSVLINLATVSLLQDGVNTNSLIYCSSDAASRSAICIERVQLVRNL